VIGLRLPRVIGHRGAAGSAPENTLASFARAAEMGVPWVELDVQLTRDGVPVVFHDDRLERTTDGGGRLVDASLAEVRRLDAGRWFGPAFAGEPVPLLADALRRISGLGLAVNIEVKADELRGPATAAAGLAVAKSVWPSDTPSPLVSSFARSALATAAETAPAWPRGLLVAGWPDDWQEAVEQLGCVALNADHQQLTASRVASVKAAGVGLLAYTVNDPERARQLWQWGVDGVFTDRPELLLSVA
jgi:glycerophosphoryl diester phosphodiesterase